jgi:hypothetical protein
MRAIFFVSLFILASRLCSQGDSVAYSKDFTLYEGLYLTYMDFRHNWPIPKEKILTKINKDQLDFYSKLIEEDKIEYVERDGNNSTIRSEKVWGFCQNNVIYLNINKSFFRIPVFGAISYFLASIDVNAYSPGYNVFINGPVGNSTTNAKEIREYLMNFYTGNLIEFNLENLEEMLKKDDTIYKEFMALSKKKKKEQANRFIRKYNEKHPVYFPKN